MFSGGPPDPGVHNQLRRLEQEMEADETRRRRRFDADRRHASYDDPLRERRWPVWQFWRRGGRRLWRRNLQDDPVPVMRASRGERARDWLRRLLTVGIIGGTTFLLEQILGWNIYVAALVSSLVAVVMDTTVGDYIYGRHPR